MDHLKQDKLPAEIALKLQRPWQAYLGIGMAAVLLLGTIDFLIAYPSLTGDDMMNDPALHGVYQSAEEAERDIATFLVLMILQFFWYSLAIFGLIRGKSFAPWLLLIGGGFLLVLLLSGDILTGSIGLLMIYAGMACKNHPLYNDTMRQEILSAWKPDKAVVQDSNML